MILSAKFPCPFCESKNMVIVCEQSVYYVHCKNCHARGPQQPSPYLAYLCWFEVCRIYENGFNQMTNDTMGPNASEKTEGTGIFLSPYTSDNGQYSEPLYYLVDHRKRKEYVATFFKNICYNVWTREPTGVVRRCSMCRFLGQTKNIPLATHQRPICTDRRSLLYKSFIRKPEFQACEYFMEKL